MIGIFNVLKPKGVGSTKIVSDIKRKFHCKAGHMGTLDPQASGVLPVAIGKACRLFDYMLEKKKVYIAEFTFGYETDTLDIEGKVINTSDTIIELEDIKREISRNIGDIMQYPPIYSAKNIEGKRSYELARNNAQVRLNPCKVHIDDIEILDYKYPVLRVKVTCGGGTYIRSIGRDIAYGVGSFATMTSLCRIQSGSFVIDDAKEVKDLDMSDLKLVPEILDFPKVTLNTTDSHDIMCGKNVKISNHNGLVLVFLDDNKLYGIGEIKENILRIKTNLYE